MRQDFLDIAVVTTAAQMLEALAVRRAVFIEEQGVSESLEIDVHDIDPATNLSAVHAIGRAEGIAVATGRLLLPHEGEGAHIGRLAVLKTQRGRGYGKAMMLFLHGLARQRGINAVTIAAQTHATAFYEALGYTARGEVFIEAEMPHRWMDIRL